MSWGSEGISQRDVEVREVDVVQKHIDPTQVVCREVNFLTVK